MGSTSFHALATAWYGLPSGEGVNSISRTPQRILARFMTSSTNLGCLPLLNFFGRWVSFGFFRLTA